MIALIRRARWWLAPAALALVASATWGATRMSSPHGWNRAEVATLRSLWLGSLPDPPPDPTNVVADDPRAVAWGRKLFFDDRLSADGTVSCATCHVPSSNFTDLRPRARGVGDVPRRTMTITGVSHSPWLFWDGRKDSLWAQALGPLESAVEHGGDRTAYAHLVSRAYREDYEAIFGALPELGDSNRFPSSAGPSGSPNTRAAWDGMAAEDRDAVTRVFVNIGKAIAAFERTILPEATRFDRYVEALLDGDRTTMRSALTADEVAGLRLFVGEAGCVACHSGPLFTNHEFHNTGVPQPPDLPADLGRAIGAPQVLVDEFNCSSPFSDAPAEACAELRFLKADGHELDRAFKVPTLRGVAATPPYMHAGQFADLASVLAHYNAAPEAPAGHNEIAPLRLDARQLRQLESFLGSLAPASSVRARLDVRGQRFRR